MKVFKSSLALSVAIFAAGSIFGQGLPIYNSIPNVLPGNVASVGYEATSTSEFGDRVVFSSGSGRKLFKVTQTMSSWGCESGNWYNGTCSTTPGATFSHPITLNVYNVGPGGSVGTLITSVTQTFSIPFRPSADTVNCIGSLPYGPEPDDFGKWYSTADSTCYNGFAVNITFDVGGVTVPNEVIYGIAYNTSHYGSAPVGESAPCYLTSGGCGYDSLNVGLEGVDSVGSNFDPDDAYIATTFAGYYCDGGLGGLFFRRDAPSGPSCNWTGYQPSVLFTTLNVPINANQCKNNGWRSRTRANGTTFRNQGDCIQYVNTGR